MFAAVYVAEEKMSLEVDETQRFFELDDKYMYAMAEYNIYIYLIDTFKLSKTIQLPDKFPYFRSKEILHMNERFYFVHSLIPKMQMFNEEGVKLDEVKLPSTGYHLTKGDAGKVLITCEGNKVFSYNPDTKKLKSIKLPYVVGLIYVCKSLGGGDYCMNVRVDDHFKLMKVVNGKIAKVLDMSNYNYIQTNGLGLVCLVEFNNNLHLLDRNLDPLMMIELKLQGSFRKLHMDTNLNINVMSFDTELHTYFIQKFKMVPK